MICVGVAIDGKRCRAEATEGSTLCPAHERHEHKRRGREPAETTLAAMRGKALRREDRRDRRDWARALRRQVEALKQSLRRHNEHVE